jgi:hypothetical protein
MLKLTQDNIDNFEKIYIPHVKSCMDVGNVARLKSVIRQHDAFVEKTLREDFIKTFAEAEAWLQEAEEFERVHGAGSRFNPQHPTVIEMTKKIADIRSEEQKLRWPS